MKNNIAVVVGGSLAGVLSAQVLSRYFQKVIVVDRDPEPSNDTPRSVPQSFHSHFLHHHGGGLINDLIPGYFEQMEKEGAYLVHAQRMAWNFFGHWVSKTADMKDVCFSWSSSRAMIDRVCRELVQKNPQVEWRYGVAVEDLIYDKTNNQITGVKTSAGEILASLTVDASGNTSKTPEWLVKLGLPKVHEPTLPINVMYTSRLYERSPDSSLPNDKYDLVMNWPPDPVTKRGGLCFPIENNRWHVSFAVQCGADFPATDEGFKDFAKSLNTQHIYEIINESKPASDIRRMKALRTYWRRYDKMKNLPDGIIAVGDALCRLNPLFAQGMTVTALTARDLDSCLKASTDIKGLAKTYYKKTSKYLQNAWMVTSSEDYRHKELWPYKTADLPLPVVRALNWFSTKVFRQVCQSGYLFSRFVKVMGLSAPPPSLLFNPVALGRVILAGLGLIKPREQEPFLLKPKVLLSDKSGDVGTHSTDVYHSQGRGQETHPDFVGMGK